MTGDGAIPVSPESMSCAGRTVRNVCSGPKAASSTATMLRAVASPEGCADKAPTPFFDLLQAMIEAHAAENRRTPQSVSATGLIDSMPNVARASRASRRTEMNTAPLAANHRWRAQQLNVCVVGLIVAVGGVFYASKAGEEQPPVIAADEAFQARSVVIGNADANDKPMERPLETEEPGGSRTIGVEQGRMDEGGIGTESTSGARADDQTVATPVADKPIEKLGSDTEDRADGVAGERMPSEAVRTDAIAPATNASAEEPSRDAPSPPPVTPESRPAIDRASDPVAIQVGRVTSGVNMRAGPGNGQPVLATIPRGGSIKVIKCHQWCEVTFAGQRGWVYKTFIRAPLADAAPERTRPSPRKAGPNSGVSRGTRTWAAGPHRLKPATARLSADQSTRDPQSHSQSSGGLWGAIGYLWKQIRPSALLPNSD